MNSKFNLIYNLCLSKFNPITSFNIRHLLTYLPKFNGKKVININYDNLSQAEGFVNKAFNDFSDIDFFFTDNASTSGKHELVPFINKLMPAVESTDDNEYTFYGHTKGISHYGSQHETQVLYWANIMYYKNLSNFDLIENILQKYCCCGTLKINQPLSVLSFVKWHYSGSFFWLKNKEIFSRDYRSHYSKNKYGIEGYPAWHFGTEQAYGIPPNLSPPNTHSYTKQTWENISKNEI